MNKNIFCNRKDGAMINGKFYPHPNASAILSKQIARAADKLQARRLRR